MRHPCHTGPRVPSLEVRESKLSVWVSRARGSMKGAQKGGSQSGGDIGFPFWASWQSRLAKMATRICSSRAHWMGLTRTAGGRIGSGVEGLFKSNARPESREISKATFDHLETNLWGCISIKRES